MNNKIRGTMMPIFLNTDTQYQNCMFFVFFRSDACLSTINKSQTLLPLWNNDIVWCQNCWSHFHLTHVKCNITKTLLFKYVENFTPQNWKFSDKKLWYFISAQNLDCGYSLEPPHRGGSNEYLQSIFLSRNKKNNVYPCKPQFFYIKVGLKGVKII